MKLFGYEIKRKRAAIAGSAGGPTRLRSDLTVKLNQVFNWYNTSTSNPSLADGINNYSTGDILTYGRTIEGLDLHLRATVEARMNRAASLGWGIFDKNGNQIKPEDFDQETQLVFDAISGIEHFDQDRLQIAESLKHGYSVMQSIWKMGEVWIPETLKHEYPENFDFDDGRSENNLINARGRNRLYMRQNMTYNYTRAKNQNKWLVTTTDPVYEDRRGVGLYQKCVFAAYAKMSIISWMLNFAERAGSGMWIGKILDADNLPQKENGDLYTSTEINTILKSISVGNVGTLPSGVDLVNMTFDKGSDVEMFLRYLTYFTNEESKIINGGQSATTEIDRVGSRAAIESFMGQERETNLISDINLIYGQINRPLVFNVLCLNRSADVANNWLKDFKVSAILPDTDALQKANVRKIEAEAESLEIANDQARGTIDDV